MNPLGRILVVVAIVSLGIFVGCNRKHEQDSTAPQVTGAASEPQDVAAEPPVDGGGGDGGIGQTPKPRPPPECRLDCCSAETLEMQRRVAAETGEPSIEHECCLCEGGEPLPK